LPPTALSPSGGYEGQYPRAYQRPRRGGDAHNSAALFRRWRNVVALTGISRDMAHM